MAAITRESAAYFSDQCRFLRSLDTYGIRFSAENQFHTDRGPKLSNLDFPTIRTILFGTRFKSNSTNRQEHNGASAWKRL